MMRLGRAISAGWRALDIGAQEALLLLALALLGAGVALCVLGAGADHRLALGAGAVVCGLLLALLAWPVRPPSLPQPDKRRTT